jgi:hypothetical protein
MKRLTVAVPALFLAAFLAGCVLASGAASPSASNAVVIIRGKLGALSGGQPTLATDHEHYKLSGQSAYLSKTLQDKRLLNQELQVVGTVQPGGGFQVRQIFAIHSGKLYKIKYYCPVCNITYVQPGHCACCGRETQLKEVPVNSNP